MVHCTAGARGKEIPSGPCSAMHHDPLGVVYGIITFVPPAGTWPEGKKFPVAPAVQCTMILSCQYFLVYGGIQVARTWTQYVGIAANFTSKAENALMTATASMNFAPMLAVLFIGARMRALNMD